jgi:hypothetical protein
LGIIAVLKWQWKRREIVRRRDSPAIGRLLSMSALATNKRCIIVPSA